MEKSELRIKYLAIRRQISDKTVKSELIVKRLMDLNCIKTSKEICVYRSIASEVDTSSLIAKLLAIGKQVYLPKTFDGGKMEFYRIYAPDEHFEKSDFGIPEPCEDPSKMLKRSEADMIIMPGVCFDQGKNRIGFGKGFYDRYLCDAKKAIKIAICFDEQICDTVIPHDDNDIRPDMILTDKRLIK